MRAPDRKRQQWFLVVPFDSSGFVGILSSGYHFSESGYGGVPNVGVPSASQLATPGKKSTSRQGLLQFVNPECINLSSLPPRKGVPVLFCRVKRALVWRGSQTVWVLRGCLLSRRRFRLGLSPLSLTRMVLWITTRVLCCVPSNSRSPFYSVPEVFCKAAYAQYIACLPRHCGQSVDLQLFLLGLVLVAVLLQSPLFPTPIPSAAAMDLIHLRTFGG